MPIYDASGHIALPSAEKLMRLLTINSPCKDEHCAHYDPNAVHCCICYMGHEDFELVQILSQARAAIAKTYGPILEKLDSLRKEYGNHYVGTFDKDDSRGRLCAALAWHLAVIDYSATQYEMATKMIEAHKQKLVS